MIKKGSLDLLASKNYKLTVCKSKDDIDKMIIEFDNLEEEFITKQWIPHICL